MISNPKNYYAVLSENFKYLSNSLIKLMDKDVKEKDYKVLEKKIKKYKRNLVKISNLITIMLFYFFSSGAIHLLFRACYPSS